MRPVIAPFVSARRRRENEDAGCRRDSLRSAKGLIFAAADSKTEHYRGIVQGLRLYCIAHVWSERCITVACGREAGSKLGFLLEENLRASERTHKHGGTGRWNRSSAALES